MVTEVERLFSNLIQQLDSNFFPVRPGKTQPEAEKMVVMGLVKKKHVAWWPATYLVRGTLPIFTLSDFTTALPASLDSWQ